MFGGERDFVADEEEVSLPESEEDEPSAQTDEDTSDHESVDNVSIKTTSDELVHTLDVNNEVSPFVGAEIHADEDAEKYTDHYEEIKKAEHLSEDKQSVSENIGAEELDEAMNIRAREEEQRAINVNGLDETQRSDLEEGVKGENGSKEDHEEHNSADYVTTAAEEKISCVPPGDISTEPVESRPNLIYLVENVLSITQNESHKALLQNMLSLAFLIKSRIDDNQKSSEIVAKLEEVTTHLKEELKFP